LAQLTKSEFLNYFKQTPKVSIEREKLEKLSLSGLISTGGLRKTRAEAKRNIAQGGVQVNGITAKEDTFMTDKLLHGEYVLLKVGKK
jgi:tyrosyl-tRNA synthetase